MSCTNLVPSCKKCNSSYKGAKNLSNEIINPFLEDFDTSAEFSLDITENSLEHLSESKILLKTTSNNESLKQKASKTIEIFNLINRYNSDTTKKDLETFLNNLELYPEIKQKEINKLVKAEKNILKYFDEMGNIEINKNRYGKLKKDIIKRYLKKGGSMITSNETQNKNFLSKWNKNRIKNLDLISYTNLENDSFYL